MVGAARTPPAVAFRGVSMTYPNGTVALSDVTFSVEPGTIHAVCGENGAGKSTLMHLLCGLIEPSQGAIAIGGVPIGQGGAASAVGMVHQHFSLIPTLTVSENIVLGREPRRGVFVDLAAARRLVEGLGRRFGLKVDPDATVGSLPVAARQKVEILKALAREPRILVLDEPTAVLSPPEIAELFDRIRGLRDDGITVIFISHKLAEVRALASLITVLRGGRHIGTTEISAVPDAELLRMVMGRQVEAPRRTPATAPRAPLLRLEGVTTAAQNPADKIREVTFTMGAGEIVGVAGVDGSGQRGLTSVLSGHLVPSAGTVEFDGRDMTRADPRTWRRAGLANVPADRYGQGGAPSLTIAENVIAGADGDADLRFGPFLRAAAIAARARGMIAAYAVRSGGIDDRLDSLSGGNAQKVIAARELATRPRLLIADQPTRGIDAAAAAFLHGRLLEAASRGCAILLVTADLDELLRLSDRVLVLFAGRIAADLRNAEGLDASVLGPFMLGLGVGR